MPARDRVLQFISLVERGEYVKAIVHAGERLPPRLGRQALVAHERKVLAGLRQMRTRRVETYLVDGDHVVINWVFVMTGPDDKMRQLDELALQVWQGERIARERFYYDPAQIKP